MQAVENIGCFKTVLDPYNGITIDSQDLPSSKEEFEINLDFLIEETLYKRNLIWIYIDIKKSHFIPLCTKRDFFFHSCDEDYILLVKRLKQNAIIPTAANHTLGVGAVVINNKNQLLVIKEKISNQGYKLPGGHIDNNEMISKAVKREVFEETGVKVEFESIISLSHLYPHQFHKSNLYVVCKAKPLSEKIDIKDTQEIIDAKWIDVQEYINDEENFLFVRNLVKVAIKNQGFIIKEEEFLKNFDKNIELFFPLEK